MTSYRNRYSATRVAFFLITILIFTFVGCVGPETKDKQTPEKIFDASIRKLIGDLGSRQTHTPAEMAPAAVMSGALKSGAKYSRLEEYIMEQLEMALRDKHHVHTLFRQNWFEYRESRPLSFSNIPLDQRGALESLIVYQVKISENEVLKKLNVHIIATDVEGQTVPGLVAETTLDYESELPAYELYNAAPKANPFPVGLEERPYRSMDRLSYGLSAELADAYKAGITAGDQTPGDAEVRVLLYTNPTRAVSAGLVQTLQDNLQQAIVGMRGFTCAVSLKDFGPAFRQVNFYRKHQSIFELEDSRFTAGTVLLMADMFKHPDGDKIGVALRAIWRVSPLESATSSLIPTNVAGTYLSGFTAKAYLDRNAVNVSYKRFKPAPMPKTHGYRPAQQKPAETGYGYRPAQQKPAETGYTGPPQDMDVCFYKFNDVYEKRIYPVLSNAPGVTDILRSDEGCEELKPCVCYHLVYQGNLEKLSAWLTENLRTSTVLPFKLKPKGDGRLEVHFNTGFQ